MWGASVGVTGQLKALPNKEHNGVRSAFIINKAYLIDKIKNMPPLCQTYLSPHLTCAELLLLSILSQLLQIHKWVRLESLANRLPIPITFESRRKRLQRFLSLKVLDVEKLWFPILSEILNRYYSPDKTLYLVIDQYLKQWVHAVELLLPKQSI
jgi:hypothetical protein